MTVRRFVAMRASKGTELARGVAHEDGTVEVTLQGRLAGFTTEADAVAALETITTDHVRLVWADE